ncbi:hypothetical protein EV657_11273 [Rhodovulum visakhapatnamense]|uniref:Tat pathway signal sequence domain protein n=2 Tax=Rhodovulum visakhapatnamense TaxID=364297 RepID=A0A4R8FZS2_9RHOB|nr:hypothetical protein [Rhodovulum sp. BSW8]TDX28245.1 hypothetical protein EV657_11273 [Rhodovulum visakhapatnamense]
MERAMGISHLGAAAAACVFVLAQGAWAEESGPHLAIELNAVAPAETGCLISFMARNGHPAAIERAVFETVLIDRAGQVERLTLFDFGDLPSGRPRVRQFSIPGLACDDLGQILINGTSACEAGALGEAACTEGLDLSTRTDVELIG